MLINVSTSQFVVTPHPHPKGVFDDMVMVHFEYAYDASHHNILILRLRYVFSREPHIKQEKKSSSAHNTMAGYIFTERVATMLL